MAILVVTLIVIGDVSYQCADRVQSASGKAQVEAIEDWEIATYLGVLVAMAGVGWFIAAVVPVTRRVARLTRPIAKYGAWGALVCALAFVSVGGTSAIISGQGPSKFLEHRYGFQCAWLFGAALGGMFGSAIGTGLGIAAYTSRRPLEFTDQEREDYREGPAGSAAGERPAHLDAGERSESRTE